MFHRLLIHGITFSLELFQRLTQKANFDFGKLCMTIETEVIVRETRESWNVWGMEKFYWGNSHIDSYLLFKFDTFSFHVPFWGYHLMVKELPLDSVSDKQCKHFLEKVDELTLMLHITSNINNVWHPKKFRSVFSERLTIISICQ